MLVGLHIKTLREAKGWTKAQLAKELSAVKAKNKPVRRASVSRWEAGIDHPRSENCLALAAVFKRPAKEFERFGVSDTGQPADAHRRSIPLYHWPDLRLISAEGKVTKHAIKVTRQIEVADSVPAHAFAIIINDRSMAPDFEPGDEVVIDPRLPPVHDVEDPDYVLVRLKTGQVVFRQYTLRAPGAYDLVGLHEDCKTESITPKDPAEMLGTMVERRHKRRKR